MAKKHLEEEKIHELEEIFGAKKGWSDTKDVRIIFDGKQYSLRIPKRFAESLDLDLGKDKFRFKIVVPDELEEDNVPKLTGELVRG